MVSAKTRRLLQNRNFLYLWLAQLLQQVSYHIINFGLIIWVYQLTGANIAVSLWILAFLIPSVVFSLFAGVLADNLDRKKIMVGANLLWAFVVLGFIFSKQSFPLILLFTFITQGIDEFFIPCHSASIPRLVEEKDLLSANSLLALTGSASVVAGSLLAGPLLRFIGYESLFILAAVLISLAALLISFLPTIEAARRLAKTPASYLSRIVSDVREQFGVLVGNRQVFTSGIFLALLYATIGAASAVAPGFMESSLGIDAKDISFVVVVPIAAGLLAGVAILHRFDGRWRKERMLNRALLTFGTAAIFLAASPFLRSLFVGKIEPSLVNSRAADIGDSFQRLVPIPFERIPAFSLLVGALFFALGLALTLIVVPTATMLQKVTPDRVRGRTFGVFNMFTSILIAFFVVVAGIVADLFSPMPLPAFMGLAAIFLAFYREQLFGAIFTLLRQSGSSSRGGVG